jgi:A/G-specific adenine glycosylase
VVRTLGEYDELSLDDLGPKVRVDYAPEGEYGREWLRGLLSDLSDDGLVEVEDGSEATTVRLRD